MSAGPFADAALAARLEAFVVREMRDYVAGARRLMPSAGAEALAIAGGLGAFVGADSPVNAVVGLGMAGEVTPLDLESAEDFFRSKGARRCVVTVCPFADDSLGRALGSGGYTLGGFENQLARPLDPADPPPHPEGDIEIIECTGAGEREEWARVAAVGFTAPRAPEPAESDIARIAAARDDVTLLLALRDGRSAGTGELVVRDGLAWLSADTTLPEHRGNGVQTALQRTRLRLALDAGCDLAATEARPGSTSQRNMERNGFRVAYTRVEMVRAL